MAKSMRPMMLMMKEEGPFDRSDRPKDSTVQDWFENSKGMYSGQTGQFIEKADQPDFGMPKVSILQPGEVGEYEKGTKGHPEGHK